MSASPRPRVGVLAIQGDVAAHTRALARAGAEAVPVLREKDLDGLAALVLPGGESTTIAKGLARLGLYEPLRAFARAGHPILGTCAGAILLAREVGNPPQPGLGALDVSIRRNAYGRQVDSSIRQGASKLGVEPLEMVFIRAPKFENVGAAVEVLAREGDDPVLIRQGRVMASTFHPELSDDRRVHQYFLDMVRNGG